MSAGFTPGPWWVPDARRLAVNSNPHNIAHANFVNGEANARLIAAAPELYEAARLLVEYDAADERDGAALILAYARILEVARAGLAKARGQ